MNLFSFDNVSKWAGYSGNSQADMMDMDRNTGEKVEDRYICTCCGFKVPEKQWLSKHNCCIDCHIYHLEMQAHKYGER